MPAREGHAAIGLKYDKHADRLFVSGGPTGKAFVYDASSGVELAAFQLTAAGQPTFINDVVLTRDAAYFTDSRQPVIYAVKRDLSGVTPITLTGFPMTAGQNNLNGIEAALERPHPARDPELGGRVVANRPRNRVTRRDRPRRGRAHQRRRAAADQQPHAAGGAESARTRLPWSSSTEGFRSGSVVRTITHPDFDVPTTVARKRGSLYLPNARFRTPPTPPETEYWVTRVSKR